MPFLSRLFGKSAAPEPAGEEHKGFRIVPEPVSQAGGYRIGARIEKEVGGTLKVHKMIRADTFASADEAAKASLGKARQLIDEQGEGIFR